MHCLIEFSIMCKFYVAVCF